MPGRVGCLVCFGLSVDILALKLLSQEPQEWGFSPFPGLN